MSLSSSSDNSSIKNIISQVITSTPQGVPDQDKMAGNEVKQLQQTRQGQDVGMESDAKVAGTQGKEKASEAKNIESQQEGIAAGKETEAMVASQALEQSAAAQATVKSSQIESADPIHASSLSSLSSVSAMDTQAIQELVAAAISGASHTKSASIETPSLPKPSVTPRQEVMEISLSLAKAITALGESTLAALSNYQSTQAQSTNMNKLSLQAQGAKIDSERAEYKKLQKMESQAGTNQTMETVNTVLMAVSITITVVSVVSALFTCGLGLIGTAAAAATGVAAGATAGATVATTVATQVTMQAVIQAVKQAIVVVVQQAVKAAVKAVVKQGIKQIIKVAIKTAAKTLSKSITRIFNVGKETLAKSFPNLSKVVNALSSKVATIAVGTVVAVPSLVKGIGDLKLSQMQNELAQIQRETGMLSAQAEMLSMFTQFWQQASKIAAKQTDGANEMQEQATKLGAQIAKAFTAISAGLASAV